MGDDTGKDTKGPIRINTLISPRKVIPEGALAKAVTTTV
jgi:hypothetical protein